MIHRPHIEAAAGAGPARWLLAVRAVRAWLVRPDNRQLRLAVGVSLLLHALLLGLQVGGDGGSLPGFSLPWQQRRGEVPDLRMVLLPPAAAPAPAPCRLATFEEDEDVERADAVGSDDSLSTRLEDDEVDALLAG